MPRVSLPALFRFFLVLTLALTVLLGVVDLGLRNAVTPNGIVSFEFCGYAQNCEAALAAWGEHGRALAMLSMGLDYFYLFAYSGFGCTALLLLARRVPAGLVRFTAALAWIAPLAAVADACENSGLIQVLLGNPAEHWGRIAGHFASVKFAIVGVSALWILFCWLGFVVMGRGTARP
ncbi:hypothetical protein D0B54_16025 [Solimonas sp. K1W22B-7]|uniref:hypothetical protein n=1 Tax=Solimonas sp. K1W22B-7 TaxID=2303331 RepID=UPI000E32D7C2|nr:hypothetical protein [Solimonas sp. K1W22B-7]AXQ30086.1 hypothetical protein D0B54_16025 [Solimonas sp. K1W22B-7]